MAAGGRLGLERLGGLMPPLMDLQPVFNGLPTLKPKFYGALLLLHYTRPALPKRDGCPLGLLLLCVRQLATP